MPTLQVKDLTREYPRSPFQELGGMPWLARLIDKVRALQAGTLGEYTPYPCGGDRRFIQTLELDAEALKAQIASGASDEAIASWVREHATPGWEQRLVEYRQGQLTPLSGEMAGYMAEAKKELQAARPELDLTDVDTWGKLICKEEGYAMPGA